MAEVENSINNSIADYIETMSLDRDGTLKSIDLTLKAIARQDGLKISQSSLKDLAEIERRGNAYDRQARNATSTSRTTDTPNQEDRGYRRSSNAKDLFDWDKRSATRKASSMFDKLTDDFEDAFTEALFGSTHPLQDALNRSVQEFASKLKDDLKVDDLGKELGKRAGQAIKNSKFGERMSAEMDWFKDKAGTIFNKSIDDLASVFNGDEGASFGDIFKDIKSGFGDVFNDLKNISPADLASDFEQAGGAIDGIFKIFQPAAGAGPDVVNMADVVGETIDVASAAETGLSVVTEGAMEAGTELATTAATAVSTGAEMTGLAGAATAAGVSIPVLGIALVGAALFVEGFTSVLGEAIGEVKEAFKGFGDSVSNAANRAVTARTKYTELANERAKQDAISIKKAAFEVIEDSAKKAEDVWKSVLTTVSATQGYDKAGVQELWSNYAKRLQEEGLDSVISSADIMEQLKSVLNSGLSGAVAEEFAYQATLLNNAIPTEDFFQYSATYASIVANAMKEGADQEHAVALANEELLTFADNLLHASRQLAGGLTTSLKNASSLFEKSAQIALTSRVGDISEISRLITSVSGVVGAIAPDLASGIVDAVYNAATGGNSSELTALRSLAGTGASNTAFLQALARDPQKVFTTLFYNLSQLQNMSSANYMEIAESLSGIFGISRDAFARVDFEYLAQAINQMNDTDGDLQQNLDLLASGQTTLTEAQVRMQKINEYMIDEGLAYVLDNEVARSIQEHMWQEQLAREIEETMFSVDLAGSALTVLTAIRNFVEKISDFLNPVGWVKKVANVGLTALENAGMHLDMAEILQKGKVGEGNLKDFTNLMTRGVDLHLATPYLNLLGGVSKANIVEQLTNFQNTILTNPTVHLLDTVDDVVNNAAIATEAAGSVVDTVSNMMSDIAETMEDATEDITSNFAEQAEQATKPIESAVKQSYYQRSVVSKSVASVISSGDWRTNAGFNAIWENYGDSGTGLYEMPTQEDAAELSDKITESVKEYVANLKNTSRSLDDYRMQLTENNDRLIESDAQKLASQGYIEHRGFLTNADVVSEVAAKLKEIEENDEAGSFEAWLKSFEKAEGIGNLSALLSDFGDSIETVRNMYEQEQAARENAATKARDIHEVQFWEDMQQFATVDFPWYMREWERYYIQHEAYTEASNNAYEEAINLAVAEKGEMGDSVLALAEALIDNNMWQEELGDKIKDPVLHTNVLLSKILLVVEAIMQQNNETSIVSVPTALSSLGLGISNS